MKAHATTSSTRIFRRHAVLPLLGAALLIFATPAFAQRGGGFGPPADGGPGAFGPPRGGGSPAAALVGREVLRAADADGDRSVTLDDLRTVVPGFDADVFARLDHDGDGALTPGDRPERPGPRAGQRGGYGARGARGQQGQGYGPQGGTAQRGAAIREKIREADADGNREVTFEELQAVMPRLELEHFERMDRNGDGVLSREDRPEGGLGGVPTGRPGGPGAGLLEADTNNDRALSLEEIQAVRPGFTAERFEQMDVNGDGLLTREDREARQGASPGRGGQGPAGQGPGQGRRGW